MDTEKFAKTQVMILNPLRIECYGGFSDLESLHDNTWKGPQTEAY
jgi:hypothetical protein